MVSAPNSTAVHGDVDIRRVGARVPAISSPSFCSAMKSIVSSAALNRVLPAGLLAVLVAGLSGCSSQVYNVKVDAIQNPEIATGYSYRIVTTPSVGSEPEARRMEAEVLVKTALAGRGMYEAPDPSQAEVEVIVDFGVSPQRLKVINYDPGFEPTVARAPLALFPVRRPDGSVGYVAVGADQLDVDGTLQGVRVLRGVYVCEKFLTISARETPAVVHGARKPAEAWQVQASVEDASDSLDGYLPVLAGAAADYLGTNTGSSQRLRVREDAEIVAFVKSGR